MEYLGVWEEQARLGLPGLFGKLRTSTYGGCDRFCDQMVERIVRVEDGQPGLGGALLNGAPRLAAAAIVSAIKWLSALYASRMASPASVVPFGLATRRATSSMLSPRASAISAVPIAVSNAMRAARSASRPRPSPAFASGEMKRAT